MKKSEGLTSAIPDILKEPIDSNKRDNLVELRALSKLIIDNNSVIAISCLKHLQDEFYRGGFVNHTILVNESDYYRIGVHPEIFEAKFLSMDNFTSKLIFIDDSEIKPVIIRNDDFDVIHKFLNEVMLTNILNNIVNQHRNSFQIYGSPEDAIRLIYAILKLLPSSLRIIPFITFPSFMPSYDLSIYPSDHQTSYNYVTGNSSDLVKAIISEIFSPASSSGLRSLYQIQTRFDEVFYSLQGKIGTRDRIDLSLREMHSDCLPANSQEKILYEFETGKFYERAQLHEKAEQKYSQLLKTITQDNPIRKTIQEGLLRSTTNEGDHEKARKILNEQYPSADEQLRKINSMLANTEIEEASKKKLAETLFKKEISEETSQAMNSDELKILHDYLSDQLMLYPLPIFIHQLKAGELNVKRMREVARWKKAGEEEAIGRFTEYLSKENDSKILFIFLKKWFNYPIELIKYLEQISNNKTVHPEIIKSLNEALLFEAASGQIVLRDINRKTVYYKELQNQFEVELPDFILKAKTNLIKTEDLFNTAESLGLLTRILDFNPTAEINLLIKDNNQSLFYIFPNQLRILLSENYLTDRESIGPILEKYFTKLNELFPNRFLPQITQKVQNVNAKELFQLLGRSDLISTLSFLLQNYGTDKARKLFVSFMESISRAYAEEISG